MTMPCETIDAGFIMRHTYVCHGVWSLIGLDTNLHVKKNHEGHPTDFEEGDMFNLPLAFEANGIVCKMFHSILQQFSMMHATHSLKHPHLISSMQLL